MKEREWAARYGHEVDLLLQAGTLPDSEPLPEPYRQRLAVAGVLAALNPDADPPLRAPLRARLLAQAAGRPAAVPRRPRPFAPGRWRVLAPLALGVLIVAGLLAMAAEHGWGNPLPAGSGVMALTASPTLADQDPNRRLASTPHILPSASMTPLVLPTAGLVPAGRAVGQLIAAQPAIPPGPVGPAPAPPRLSRTREAAGPANLR